MTQPARAAVDVSLTNQHAPCELLLDAHQFPTNGSLLINQGATIFLLLFNNLHRLHQVGAAIGTAVALYVLELDARA